MANFNQLIAILQEAADDAQLNVVTWQRTFVTDFTETGLIQKEFDRLWKAEAIAFHAVLLAILVLGAVEGTVVSGGTATGAIIAGIAAIAPAMYAGSAAIGQDFVPKKSVVILVNLFHQASRSSRMANQTS